MTYSTRVDLKDKKEKPLFARPANTAIRPQISQNDAARSNN